MPEREIYPLSKAAFVLREPVEDVRRTVERRQIQSHLVICGGRKVRAVDHKTLVFLSWANEHHADLKPALYKKFYESLRRHKGLPTEISSGTFQASLVEAVREVQARLETLHELEKQVERNAAGEPVLKGTEVEVHRIAALRAGGMTSAEVRKDYPSLTPDQIDFASAYAAANPKPGRPYPKLTAKEALRRADFSALEDDD